MAPYPAFADYQKRGNFRDGIKRCDDLLKKNPNDVQLLSVKLQLLYAVQESVAPVFQHLISIQPPIQDIGELLNITDVVVNAQRDDSPSPSSAGPDVAKLWEQAVKATTSVKYKWNMLLERFTQAITANYIADAQQALIQLKVVQPKNRVVYMAHAALTQILSTSSQDLQSRLALSLARKAVTERFDEDQGMDCRVPGQIFALQGSTTDLEVIRDRPFKESKHVYDAMRPTARVENGSMEVIQPKDPGEVSPAEWLVSEVAGLKGQFARLIDASAGVEAYLMFATNATRLVHTALTSIPDPRMRGSADACFLAISSLIKVYELQGNSSSLLCAAYVAETLLKHHPHVHEARLVLVYLYMRLGLGSLAVSMFDTLSIKETQFDTVGHALFTRLPLLHPQPVALGKGERFVVEDRLVHALKMYSRTEDRIAETEANVLSHGQTGMIFDLHQLRTNLRSSTARRIMILELRRARRLTGATKDHATVELSPRRAANWAVSIDNRDFNATFNFGFNVEKALYGYRGVIPDKKWILHNLAADTAWNLATEKPDPLILDPENLLQISLEGALDLSALTLDEGRPDHLGMIPTEYLTGDLIHQVLRLLLQIGTASPTEKISNVEAVSKAIDRLNVDRLLESSDSCTDRLMDHYLFVDALLISAAACSFVAKETKEQEDKLRQLQLSAVDLVKAIQVYARKQIKAIKTEGIETLMRDDTAIFEALKAFGNESIHQFSKSVAASAVEGWEGLLKTSSLRS